MEILEDLPVDWWLVWSKLSALQDPSMDSMILECTIERAVWLLLSALAGTVP